MISDRHTDLKLMRRNWNKSQREVLFGDSFFDGFYETKNLNPSEDELTIALLLSCPPWEHTKCIPYAYNMLEGFCYYTLSSSVVFTRDFTARFVVEYSLPILVVVLLLFEVPLGEEIMLICQV